MLPSKEDVTSFLAFAPDAGEGKAFMFLEGAGSIEEAVNQFYETPNKYSGSHMSATSETSKKSLGASPPVYSPPPYAPPESSIAPRSLKPHTNVVIEAGHVRARDEQVMQNRLQSLQLAYRIYNSDIEPEHDTDYYCNCPIHQYKSRKINRLGVQEMWSKAVMYPGEKAYHDCYQTTFFTSNPYRSRIISPYGLNVASFYGVQSPSARYYAMAVRQTIQLNTSLNAESQAAINRKEPQINIWELDQLDASMSKMDLNSATPNKEEGVSMATSKKNITVDKKMSEDWASQKPTSTTLVPISPSSTKGNTVSKFNSLKKAFSITSSEDRAAVKANKLISQARELRTAILEEENGRWPDHEWRSIVRTYQERVGMLQKISELRTQHPIQYLHLLRAGYFEPIPIAWANLASNPLKFTIEASGGWRGITPTWRGYEDTAEERLYWVMNHREGTTGARMKPDIISAMDMARARMASAVEPPPTYFSADDTCHLQHTSDGYSKQVMPAPFVAFDSPEVASDDTMILLDVSGSMDFDPIRPNYKEYLITGYTPSTQPKNKDVAKAIVRRFTDAMANHDHNFQGYQLTTFSTQAHNIGIVNHRNLDAMWQNVRLGGGTRVMTGWQKVKDLHFQKHSESATYHPVYGWQAGPQTPMLRLLILLDGEATDMDEFELDILGLSWVHITIFLIGVDGCPHHHRHANELQRISEVNHHVSFVDAQGNTPERFVTHELLKRHLGYEVSMSEFEELEQPPAYVE